MSYWEPWWKRYPSWLEEEHQAFRDRNLDFAIDPTQQQIGRIILKGRAPISPTETAEISVVYPDTYPNTRPLVYMLGRSLDRHQNPINKNLCVLPRGSEYWRPSMKAAELVDRISKLIEIVERGGPVADMDEDPQGEPFSEYYSYESCGGVLIPREALVIPQSIRSGFLELRLPDNTLWLLRAQQQRFRALLSIVKDQNKQIVARAENSLVEQFSGATIRGQWLRLDAPIRCADAKDFRKQLVSKLTKGKKNSPVDDFVAALFLEEVQQDKHQDSWVFSVINPRKKEESALLRGMRYTEEDLASRIPELRPLRSKTISLVGLGSLGSPLAHECARAQIKELKFLDPDHVDAGTGVRWLLGLDAAGLPKASFLKKFLERNYPFVRIESFSTRIGDASLTRQEGPTENQTLQKLMEGTNLVVDTAAEENVSGVISRIAGEIKIPQIYLWGIDGYGGVVARVNPKKGTGCYHCLALSLADSTIKPPEAASGTKLTRVQPRGCGDPTFAAAAIDLMPIVSQAARLAFSTLCEDSSEGAYPKIEDDVFVLQLRAPDGALITPCWRAYPLAKHPKCVLCSPSP